MADERLATSLTELLHVVLLCLGGLLLGAALSFYRKEPAMCTTQNIGGSLLLKGTPVCPDGVHAWNAVECGQHLPNHFRFQHGTSGA